MDHMEAAGLSKGELAYRELRRRIITGDLEPGSRLSQYQLAADMGMSITPLREAIRRLASEGWVELDTHRDVKIAALDATEAHELLEVRLSLEPLATELAAQFRTSNDILAMTSAADRLLPVNRAWGEEGISVHREFHRAIYLASHNRVLIRLLDDLWDKSDRYRRLALDLPAGDNPRSTDFKQHQELLDLISEGNSSAARELSRDHIRNSLGATIPDALGRSRRWTPPPLVSRP